MDPFASDSELATLTQTFQQAQYASVLSDYSPSDFSPSNTLAVRILQYRAQIALHKHQEVLSSITATEASSTPALAAVKALAEHCSSPTSTSAVSTAETLANEHGSDTTVQICAGTVLARAGQGEEALKLLSKHEGSLEAVMLIVQTHLGMNRADLASKECKSARGFAQDALGVNLAESWVGVREGGEAYQRAFYVFEELAQNPSTASPASLTAQAVSELHMGRLEEAETALNQALELNPRDATAMANLMVLETVAGRKAESRAKLEAVDKEHEILKDLEKKRAAFRSACEKYSPKFA